MWKADSWKERSRPFQSARHTGPKERVSLAYTQVQQRSGSPHGGLRFVQKWSCGYRNEMGTDYGEICNISQGNAN